MVNTGLPFLVRKTDETGLGGGKKERPRATINILKAIFINLCFSQNDVILIL